MADEKTIGEGIAEKFGLLGRDEQTLADSIDRAIAAAFKTGFEHAVAGGEEAGRKIPQLKDSMPLVLYCRNEADRQEIISGFAEALGADRAEIKIPEKV